MEISEERLKALVQEAVDQAVAKVLEKPTLRKINKVRQATVQIRERWIARLMFSKMGIDLRDRNLSELVREALASGLKEIKSFPTELRTEDPKQNPRFNARVDIALVLEMKALKVMVSDVFLLGLICKAIDQENKTAK